MVSVTGERAKCSELATPALLGDSIALEVPGVVHHELEVVVSVDGHGDVVVVLEPLVDGDTVVTDVFLVVGVMGLEGVDELVENLVLGLLSGLDIGVHLSVVSLSDVVDINDFRAVLVHDLEGLASEVSSELVHLTTDTSEELFVVDGTIVGSVEDLEELLRVGGVEANTEVVDTLLELINVERSGAVIISNLELTAKTHDTAGTTSSKLLSEVIHKLSLSVVHGRDLGGLAGELGGSGGAGSGGLSAGVAPALLGDSRAIKVPGAGHHDIEVLVAVDGGRDVVVVLLKLFLGNNVIGSVVVSHVVGSLEGLEELLEDLLLGLLARDNVGVLGCVIGSTDVGNVNVTIVVLVEDSVGLGDNALSVGVHGSTDGTEELVVLNKTTAVIVEEGEEVSDLTLTEAEHVVLHGLSELKLVKGHGVVIVHDTELTGETDDTAGTTGGELLSEALDEVLGGGLATLGGGDGANLTAEKTTGKFSVVKRAALIGVIN